MKLPELRFGSGNTQLLLPVDGSDWATAELPLNVKNLENAKRGLPPLRLYPESSMHMIAGVIQPAISPATRYINAAIADNTRRAYQQDLQDFRTWGGSVPCTADELAAYIAERAEVSSAQTITRRIVGIGRAHVSQGYANPAKSDLVRTVLRGVRRVKGTAQRQVSPLLRADILAIVDQLRGVKGIRDRALILLGFSAALRRSELTALDFGDIEFVREGLIVHVRRSKTDQAGEGRKIGVPWGRTSACAVKAVENWLQVARIESGPVFRSVSRAGQIGDARLHPQSIALLLKQYAKQVGLNPGNISGHSLRSGLVTSAIQAGVGVHKIQQQTGHRSVEMLVRYIRDAGLFESNASGSVL